MKINSLLKKILILVALILLVYGAGRLYFAVTAGFTIGNITSDLPYDPRWQTHDLALHEKNEIGNALEQEFDYLGKGCQSYVFASRDGKYVIKFFKYQRFRPQRWINLFTFIPPVAEYQNAKAVVRKNKLDNVFRSWKIAFENLKDETGVIYVHLNKSDEWHKILTINDKMGFQHKLEIDQLEFMVQKRAKMLSAEINTLVAEGHVSEAEQIIDRLFSMLLSEYSRGFADNDHALMQNTGVIDGRPIHIDAGQFIHNETVKDPAVFKQEIYDKTYNFNRWLQKHHSGLGKYLENRLLALIGPDYYFLAPYKHKGNVAKIPHQDPQGQ